MNTIEKLNALAEYQAQVDLLNIKRQELLDEVKVPDEVLEIQKQGEHQKAEIERHCFGLVDAINQERIERLSAIIIPPEIQAALDKVISQRTEIEDEIQSRRDVVYEFGATEKSKIEAAFYPKVNALYAQLAQRKSEINTEFEDKTSGALDNIAKLTAEIKAETIKAGESIKGTSYQAVYSKGRTTWKTDILDDVYFALNAIKALLFEPGFLTDAGALPTVCAKVSEVIKSLEKARHIGEPSVAIRKI